MTRKLIMAFAAVAAAFGAWAETEETVGGYTWTYRINGDTAAIFNNYSVAISPSPTGTVTIPSTLGGKPVTSIGDRAFYGCSGLTSVTIPDSVTSIGNRAFAYCSGLTSVTMPDSVTSIGECAFYNCSGLASVKIPDSVTIIREGTFDSCNDALYDTATISGVKLVDGWAIGYTDALSGALALKGVRGIGSYAFDRCGGLTSVTIPDGVKSIGDCAFYGCSGLTSVTIPNSVTSVGEGAFYGCNDLLYDTTTIPGVMLVDGWVIGRTGTFAGAFDFVGVRGIVPRAFYRCSGLTSVTIPDGMTCIGEETFLFCNGLTRVVIPDSVTSIGDRAFCCCSGLKSVTLGNGVTSIGNEAFQDCRVLTSLTIPDSVVSIGDHAFAGCDELNVTIGKGVAYIGDYAFGSCFGTVTFRGDAPNVVGDYAAFKGMYLVYLPSGNTTYDVVDGYWQEMTVKYYDVEDAPTIGVNDKGTVEGGEDGGYVVTAKEGETLTAEDFTFIVAPKAAYKVVIADGGATATVSLNEPQVGVLPGQAEEVQKDEDDKSGLLVEVADSMISEKPEAKAGEVVGALPVKTYPGLWYKVAWGDDLSDLTEGRKVQATGDSLYLGVIKQKGSKGFYRLTVSEQ